MCIRFLTMAETEVDISPTANQTVRARPHKEGAGY